MRAAAILMLVMVMASGAWAQEPDWAQVERVLIAEAASEGYDGLYAVACVVRNRGWSLAGFSAARRTDLRAFSLRQPEQVQRWAAAALARVRAGGPDITQGATHYENVGRFGTPRWAKGHRPVYRLGAHTFWRLP